MKVNEKTAECAHDTDSGDEDAHNTDSGDEDGGVGCCEGLM